MPRKVPIEIEQDICSKYYTHTARELEKEYDYKYSIWNENIILLKSFLNVWNKIQKLGK